MKKVIIIGGMAAGCKTAARLRRNSEEYDITIIEKLPIISFGTCGMPFYAAGDIENFDELMTTQYGMLRSTDFFDTIKNIKVLVNTQAQKIDYELQLVECFDLVTDKTSVLEYDYLVIATGANPIVPNISMPKSEMISTFHNPFDAKKFKQLAQTGKIGSVAIIGGGYIGCELAEATSSLWGIETTIIEREASLLPKSLDKEVSSLLEKVLVSNSVELKLNSNCKSIEQTDDGILKVILEDETLKVDYVFLCIGVKPATELVANSKIKLGQSGGIIVDEQMRTNLENVWAAGDCIEVKNLITSKSFNLPLGSIANRQGRVVADSIAGKPASFNGVVTASSIKVFENIVSSVGINEAECKRNNFNFDFVLGSWFDRPEYHPESSQLFGKMVYNKDNHQLLGLQLIGKGEVSRYIDAFSVMLKNNAKLEDALEFEHSYTPPHSSPINIINNLAAMALNQEEFAINCISPIEPLDSFKIIDVRQIEEVEVMPIENVFKFMSLDKFRQKINELSHKEKYLVVCQKGPRSAEVAKTIYNFGYKYVAYLGGGVHWLHRNIE